MKSYDLLIAGAGINGAGIARDASGNGLKVFLCDAGDIGGGTSAASTKLIHGGLRYLEFYEFGLVRKALAEREVILRIAPHISAPMAFVLPHVAQLRSPLLIRLGLFLYDHLARRVRVPGSQSIDLRQDPAGAALQEQYRSGFRFWDGWIADNRLTVLNAMDAAAHGAVVSPRTALVKAVPDSGQWICTLSTGETCAAKAIVNATGPWATAVARSVFNLDHMPVLRLVKGSHIVVPRVNPTEDAFFLQQPDGRVVFIIPFEADFSLIGTTEEQYNGDPRGAQIDTDEIAYLLAAANRFLRVPLSPSDVAWTFAGVRPLIDSAGDSRSASRDWQFDLHAGAGPPVLTVLGGKLTTYRVLAEAALDKLMPLIGRAHRRWTATAALPGGEALPALPDWIPAALRHRLASTHGSLWPAALGHPQSMEDLDEIAGGLICKREVAYMVAREWVQTADDLLWRRTKLGLHLNPVEQAKIRHWIDELMEIRRPEFTPV